MPEWKIDNFLGVVKDVGTGKQPQNTLADSKNFTLQRKIGSLVSRYGYSAGLTKPTGLDILDEHLCFPVTKPAASDVHLWFGRDSGDAKHIYANPFYHNSATAQTQNSGWVDIQDSKVIASLAATPTVTPDTTNTIALTGADTCTALGLVATTDYYKNWVMAYTKNGTSLWLVKSYTIASDLATFTLDSLINADSGVVVTAALLKDGGFTLWRYFHSDRDSATPFTPSYVTPAGYSTDLAVRFSGGQGSTVGYKNTKFGYIKKTFFPSVTNRTHAMEGSYCDQAECAAPVSAASIFKSVATADVVASANNFLDTPSNDGIFTASTTHWAPTGASIAMGLTSGNPSALYAEWFAAGSISDNYIKLPAANVKTLTDTNVYSFEIEYEAYEPGTSLGVSIESIEYVVPLVMGTISQPIRKATIQFTKSGTGTTSIYVWSKNILTGPMLFRSFTLRLSSEVLATTSANPLETGYTYTFYAAYKYDGFQTSELTRIGSSYLNVAVSKLQLTLKQSLANLNKFVTDIQIYATKEKGNVATTTRTEPAYLIQSAALTSADTGWSFNAATGIYEYVLYVTDILFNNSPGTWEQMTGRIASASTTCSYSIAAPVSGRIMLAQDYDYADAALYTNRLRFTGFSGITGQGSMCPDIFPNDGDYNISSLTQGNGVDIKAIIEHDGDCIVWKTSSMLYVTTSQPGSLWITTVLSDSIGATNKFVPKKLGRSIYWSDPKDIYKWNGGEIVSLGRGVCRDYYQSIYNATQRAWVDNSDSTYNLWVYQGGGVNDSICFVFDSISPLPVFKSFVDISAVAVDRSGKIWIAQRVSGSFANSFYFSTATVDGATAIPASFDTGWITPEDRAFIQMQEIWLDVEIAGTLSGIAIVVQVDDASLSFVTAPTLTTAKKYHRIPLPANAQGHRFRITWACSSTGTLIINRMGALYSIIPEYGDMR